MTYLLYLPVLEQSNERMAYFNYHLNALLWGYGYFLKK